MRCGRENDVDRVCNTLIEMEQSTDFWKGRSVAVTGGAGFLGSAVVRLLEERGANARAIRSAEYDLRDPQDALEALADAEVVINLAARVGGIGYNRRNPAPLLRENPLLAVNVFDAAREHGVEKLVTAGSVCAYPKFTPVPFSEDEIWNGYPEESNAPYGVAKRVAQELADTYRRQYGLDAVIPVLANLYGPGDNFDLEDCTRCAGADQEVREAAERGDRVSAIWGTGSASREFLYVDDGARALLLAAERLETSDAGERRHRAGDEDPRPRGDDSEADRVRGRDRVGRDQTGRAARSAASMSPGLASCSASKPRLRWKTAWAPPSSGSRHRRRQRTSTLSD